MSKFQSYAKQAEKIYQQARRDYTKVQDDFQRAKSTYDKNKRPAGPWKATSENIARAARAEADFLEAKQQHKDTLAALQNNVKSQISALRGDLAAAVQRHYTADPAALDMATLELLKSGILNPGEYQGLAEKNSDNITMLRLIAQYAKSAADKLPDIADNRSARMALLSVAQSGKEDGSGVLEAFDFATSFVDKTIQNDRYMADGFAAHWDETGGKAFSLV